MKIAVTSQNRKTVTKHAGVCRNFWVYNIVNQQIADQQLLELNKDQSFHNCTATVPQPLESIDVLLTGGMGEGLTQRLARKEIKAVVTEETDPTTAVNHYLKSLT